MRSCQELPPRTRRILLADTGRMLIPGTTSAHAENTEIRPNLAGFARNYLRARGEYQPQQPPGQCKKELPPRTRRIRHHASVTSGAIGTTSAHAENTWREERRKKIDRNYLRARGEYS